MMIKCDFNCFECVFDDCKLSGREAELLARLEKKEYSVEQIKEIMKPTYYYSKNREKYREKARQYCLKNQEKIKEYRKQYYLKNREKIKEHKRKYNQRKLQEKECYTLCGT